MGNNKNPRVVFNCNCARKAERDEILTLLKEEMSKELKKYDLEPTQRYFTLKDIEKLINNKK